MAPSNGASERVAATINGRSNGKRRHLSPESEGSSDGGQPLSKRRKPSNGKAPKKRKAAVAQSSSDLSDDDVPLAAPAKQIKSAAIPPSTGIVSSGDVPPAATAASKTTPATKVAPVKEESDSDDDVPLGSRPTPKKKTGAVSKPTSAAKKRPAKVESESEDDVPLKAKKPAKKVAKKVKKEESDEDSDVPLKKKVVPAKKKAKVEPSSEGDTPVPSSSKAKGEDSKQDSSKKEAKAKKKAKEEEGEEDEDQYRWWEEGANGDNSEKWKTLEHQGVLFPPPYESLPKDVKMKYDGKPVTLPPQAEEVAGFFAALLETDHATDEKFVKNFFTDFQGILEQYPPAGGVKIIQFEKCDFRPMFEYFEAEKAKKKAMTAAEKKVAKAAKDELEEKYKTCLLDGRKEKVGNFRAEPPGLFRGRGDHPRKGALKYRIGPEDIIINIGKDAPVPVPNIPGKWKEVIHDNTVTWLANWKENVNGNFKYVFLAAGSSLKGQSDMMKFEKARELKNHVARIRQDYTKDLTNKVMAERQRATAMYFIDRLALRAGNEKGEDEADTVGCCSLRYEHITLEPPDQLVFDFLGKDSIRYYNVVKVEPQIYKNIRIFKTDKTDGDDVFDRVNTSSLNKHLTSYMKGLTAKVFRTYNASITFQEQLDKLTPPNGTTAEKLAAYNTANRLVAKLCNHQKSVSKNHAASMEKIDNQIKALKYQRRKLRFGLLGLDPKIKKKKPELKEEESDIDDEWIAQYEDESREKEIEKARKKFEKDNEKKKEDREELVDESVLEGKIEKINDEYDRLKGERGKKEAEVKGKKTAEQLEAAITKLDEKIQTVKFQKVDREEGKEIALGTSKINYLDPRITTSWCKMHDVPVEKLFSKTLLVKFPWAMEVEAAWKF